ncbi:MAG: S41 family peptidase [Paracoccaceae bacterium]
MGHTRPSLLGKILRGALVLFGGLLFAFIGFWVWGMPGADLRGQWRTQGYGIVADIGRFTIDMREITPVSCERYQLAPANLWLLKTLGGIEFETVDGALVIHESSTVNPIGTDRLDGMPEICEQGAGHDADDPEWNFEVFWNAFAEHYPFFDLYGVDWDARYAEFRPQVTATTTPDELFEIFRGLVHGLEDGHVYFVDRENRRGHSPETGVPWGDALDDVRVVAKTYLGDAVIGIDETGLSYGWLDGGVGYIRLTHMEANTGFGSTGASVAMAAIQTAAIALSDAQGIIVDVRFNPGGDDSISLAYAGAFTDHPVQAFSKVTQTLDGFTPPHIEFTQPNGTVFLDQPVILLTSGYSASAAEIFTMALRELPQVTVMGQDTAGAHSDILSRNLPNGWEIGFSHQIYTTPGGQVFEGPGLPADLPRDFDLKGFNAGKDTLLQEAAAILGN